MSKINIKATIVANDNVVAGNLARRTPVITRVQIDEGYTFVNNLDEVRKFLETGNYSIFVNHIRGKNNNTPFEKGQLCPNYKEAIEYIASHSEKKYRVDLVLRNHKYNADELKAIASNLDF